jgi:hypothetical protein
MMTVNIIIDSGEAFKFRVAPEIVKEQYDK